MSLVAAYFCHISLVLSHVVELFSSVMNWHREQVLHRQVSSNVILFMNLVYLFCIQFVSWFKETNWSPAGLCTPDLLEKKVTAVVHAVPFLLGSVPCLGSAEGKVDWGFIFRYSEVLHLSWGWSHENS